MKKSRKMVALCLSASLTCSLAGCQSSSSVSAVTDTESTSAVSQVENGSDEAMDSYKIGVAVYNQEDDEVKMFRSYYEDYLSAAFNVEFLYSDSIRSIEEEKQFVDQAKAEGCEGIISYVSYDLPEITAYCADELYYVLASGSFTESELESASQHEKFLGITGPSSQEEFDAGKNLVTAMQNENGDTLLASQKTWILFNGGAAAGNYMHEQRFRGALEEFEAQGFTLTASADELKAATENCLAAEHSDGGKVYLCPGYYYTEDTQVNLTKALEEIDPDTVISVCSLAVLYDTFLDKEKAQGKNMQIGAVDCFSETNREAYAATDAFGNSSIDCIVGKCQAMGAPAFIAMYNAVTGHADVVRDNGQAYRLTQDMWTARSAEEYEELSAKASNIYENIYTTEEMMGVLAVFNSSANYSGFKTFVEKL